MSTRRIRGTLTLATLSSLVALGLVVAPAALAKSRPQESFRLQGSNGYTIKGFGFRDGVSLTPHKGPASATYSTDGNATARAMRMDLGKFGEVHVRFHARRTEMVSPPRGCTGPKAKERIGIWRGKIRFKGEHRYTTAKAAEARGKVFFPVDLDCHGGKLQSVTTLSANKGTTASFGAIRVKGSSKTTFTALDFGQAGAVNIFRSVELTAPRSTFTFNDALTRAHVKPPWPFSGTGDFASPSSWTGPLMVRFPGKRLALTGAGWTAGLSEFNP